MARHVDCAKTMLHHRLANEQLSRTGDRPAPPAAPQILDANPDRCADLEGDLLLDALAELRTACRIRTATLCAILNALTADGTVRKTPAGYTITR